MPADLPDTESVDERIAALVGRRPVGGVIRDVPGELGYRCPLHPHDPDYETLMWSEFNGFVWCARCERDWPSALCVDVTRAPDPDEPWVHAGPDAAVAIFLASVADAAARARGEAT